jgi:hypothetical protein
VRAILPDEQSLVCDSITWGSQASRHSSQQRPLYGLLLLLRPSKASGERRERRLQRFEQVNKLHAQGTAIREIARQMHKHPRAVRRWISRATFPERAIHAPRRQGDARMERLQQRWRQCSERQDAYGRVKEIKRLKVPTTWFGGWRQPGSAKRRRVCCPRPQSSAPCDSPTSIA